MQCMLSFALIPSRIFADPIDSLLRAEPGTQGRKGRRGKKREKQRLSSAICIIVRARCRRGPPAAGCRPQDEQGRSRSAAGNYMAVSPWLSQLWWRRLFFPSTQPASYPRTHTARHTLVAGKEGNCCRCLDPPPSSSPAPALLSLVNGWHHLGTTTMTCPYPKSSDTAPELACGSFKSGGRKRPDG